VLRPIEPARASGVESVAVIYWQFWIKNSLVISERRIDARRSRGAASSNSMCYAIAQWCLRDV